MSAMSASPVKPPVLPPSGVNVTPPVATSPPKGGMMPMPANLTIAPTKPPNMNHTAMPLSLIADHKMAPQFPTQSQMGVPPVMQPIPQSLPRAPEKPKELSAPIGLSAGFPVKPTSNGMEGLPLSNPPLPTSTPALPEAQVSAAPPFKIDQQPTSEMPDGKPTLPENASETLTHTVSPAENVAEKKEDIAVLKPVEPVAETAKVACVPTPQQSENTPTVTTVTTPAPVSVPTPTPAVGPVPPTTTTPSTPATPVATPQPTPPAEQPTVTPSVSRTETSIPHSKPELKVATIPRQAAKRKREPKAAPPSPEVKKEGKDDDRKSKRVRLPTQPYQSPLPELNIIAKINKSTPSKAADDKLIVFYKNEFLAVRNAEGGFYVCQAMQNIYKSSPRIRIRWLSQEGGKDTYSPDFYDHTDFDCILTNLNLDKVDKEKFRLPLVEQQRTESILKRALDVEKGVSEKPPVTEEHPDGLDLSLFRDESQLKKSKSRSRNSSTGKKSDSGKSDDGDSSEEGDDEEEEEKEEKTKKESPPKTSKKKKKSVKKKPPAEKKSAPKSSSNKSTVQAAKKKTDSRVGTKRKSPVSTNSQPAEKRSRTSSQPSDRTNKTRSVEATAGVKSQRDRRAKSRK